MILMTLLILTILFLSVCIVPFVQWIISRNETEEVIEYVFSPKLFDMDLNDLKWESSVSGQISKLSLSNRGSVRIAQGRILTQEAMEEKKATVFSVELP